MAAPLLLSFIDLRKSTVEDGWLLVLAVVAVLAGVLLFTPYETVLEGIIAVVMVTAVLAGFFNASSPGRILRTDRPTGD